jgi:hypothetical protein
MMSAFCSSPVSRARLSVKVSEMRKFTVRQSYEFSSSSKRVENCGRNFPMSIK